MFLARIHEASAKRLTGDLWIVASCCDMSGHGLFVCSVQLPEHSCMESQWDGLVSFSVNRAHSILDMHGCSQSKYEEQIALL